MTNQRDAMGFFTTDPTITEVFPTQNIGPYSLQFSNYKQGVLLTYHFSISGMLTGIYRDNVWKEQGGKGDFSEIEKTEELHLLDAIELLMTTGWEINKRKIENDTHQK